MTDTNRRKIETNPDKMDSLYKVFRAGFLESGEGWNGETYRRNAESYERRLQARFEALCEQGEFEAPSNEVTR